MEATIKDNSCMFQCYPNEMKNNQEIVMASTKVPMGKDQIGITSSFKQTEKQQRN